MFTLCFTLNLELFYFEYTCNTFKMYIILTLTRLLSNLLL